MKATPLLFVALLAVGCHPAERDTPQAQTPAEAAK
jgi:hypothetical protein